jgi:hypothetical protein
MVKIAVLSALLALTWATPAIASECLTDMKEVDEALAKGTKKLSAADLEKVKRYRADGEKLQKAGKEKQCVDTVEKAKVLLGI